MNADFIRIAHRRTIWSELQRILLERYLNSDQPAREQMICEEVPFSQKEVTQEALFEVLEKIEQLQQDERYQMSQFEFSRKRDQPHVHQPKEPPRPKEPAAKGGKSKSTRKREPQQQSAPEGVEDGGQSSQAG